MSKRWKEIMNRCNTYVKLMEEGKGEQEVLTWIP